VELNPQVTWTMDAEGQALEVNPRWEELTGLTPEQARGHGWMEALHPDDRERTMAGLNHCLASGEPVDVEYRLRRREGGWRWMRSRGARRTDSSGQVIRWYGSVEDIDDRKRTEEALRLSEACLNAVADSFHAGIVVADAPDGKLRVSNPEARRLLGEGVLEAKAPEFSEHLAKALSGETTECEVIPFVRGDGVSIRIEVSGAPVRDAGGAVKAAMLFVCEAR
jgi:PAS domain S-box-containing protein